MSRVLLRVLTIVIRDVFIRSKTLNEAALLSRLIATC